MYIIIITVLFNEKLIATQYEKKNIRFLWVNKFLFGCKIEKIGFEAYILGYRITYVLTKFQSYEYNRFGFGSFKHANIDFY